MSRYADLRWKIADLEKELEKAEHFNELAMKHVCGMARQIDAKDAEIKELKALLKERESNG